MGFVGRLRNKGGEVGGDDLAEPTPQGGNSKAPLPGKGLYREIGLSKEPDPIGAQPGVGLSLPAVRVTSYDKVLHPKL